MGKVDVVRASEVQKFARERVLVDKNCFADLNLLGAVDVAYSGSVACAAVVAYETRAGGVVESRLVVTEARAPYIPGYLFLRELGPMLAGYKALASKPDVVLINGHGYSHPRRIGIASYFGLVASLPTIGVARGLLVGEELCPDGSGSLCFVTDGEELIAVSLPGDRGRWYVSAGHCITLSSALRVVSSILERHEGSLYPMVLADSLSRRCIRACTKRGQRTNG